MLSNSETSPSGEVTPTGINPPVDFAIIPRKIFFHQIPDGELDTIAASGSSLHLTLFGICIGAFISLLVTVTTAKDLTSAALSAYVSATIITALGSIFFGWRGIAASIVSSKKLTDLRRGIPSGPAHHKT
jgi:hypothetical protein